MGLKYFTPGKSTLSAILHHNGKSIPKTLDEMPGGLYPIRMALWETDRYRIRDGWPVAPPKLDVFARSLVSSSGEVLVYREGPRGIETNADIRWIADEDFFNLDDLTWYPFQNQYSVAWHTGATFAPTYIDQYQYRRGNEFFYESGLNFDSDSKEHMYIDLGSAIGGSAGYTVVMCLTPNSVYGTNDAVPYSGLWCPGAATPGDAETFTEPPQGGWVSLTLQGSSLYLESDQTPRARVVRIPQLTSTAAPVYIAMVVGRPYTTIYAGLSTASMTKTLVGIGDQVKPFDGNIVLGRTNGDLKHCADMMMFDMNFYTDKLSPAEVRDEIAMLAGVYGGDK